jgi:hypothetical protein
MTAAGTLSTGFFSLGNHVACRAFLRFSRAKTGFSAKNYYF